MNKMDSAGAPYKGREEAKGVNLTAMEEVGIAVNVLRLVYMTALDDMTCFVLSCLVGLPFHVDVEVVGPPSR